MRRQQPTTTDDDAHRQLSVVGHIVFRPSSVLRLLLHSFVRPSTAFLLPEVSIASRALVLLPRPVQQQQTSSSTGSCKDTRQSYLFGTIPPQHKRKGIICKSFILNNTK